MRASFFVRSVLRESRGARGRMSWFVLCLAIGVAAVVGAAALSEAVDAGFRAESRELLGGDLAVDARRPLPPELDALFASVDGVERSDVVETATMVRGVSAGQVADGVAPRSRLALLVAVSGRYPLYGELTTEPPGGLAAHLRDDTVVAARALLDSLALAPGDDLTIGGRRFRIAAAVVDEPASFGLSALLGPHVYVTQESFGATGLMGFGSRARYRALFALPGAPSREDLDAWKQRIETGVPGAAYLDVSEHYESGPGNSRSYRRAEGVVGLVALLSLVVGGIGVAQIVGAWIAGRTASIAVLRCLGLRPREILLMSLAQVTLLALCGSLLGAVLGCALPPLVTYFAPDLLPVQLGAVFPAAAVARGVVLGVGLAWVFSLPPLTAVWRVSPARVLRTTAEPLPAPRGVLLACSAALYLGVFGAAFVQSRSMVAALVFSVGFAALVGLLVISARGLMHLAGRLPRARLGPYLRHGVAALGRPGAGTTGAVVALGLGTLVVASMWLVETRVRAAITAQIPADAPSVFLVDIRPAQWDGVRALLTDAGATRTDQVPVVMARIAAIDGRSVDDLARDAADDDALSRRTLMREQRLTWRATLTPDNRIVEGALWSEPGRPEVSVEQRFAERLGVHVGSRITFDVQGVPLEVDVTSLRSVEWQSFSINFFLVLEPGALESAPAVFLSNARVPEQNEQRLQDALAAGFPNVTMIRVRPILERVTDLIERLVAGLSVLGWFTVAAGVAILAGAVSSSSLRRASEVALLKTLGVTRGGVLLLLAVEYALCGALAGTVGAGGALLLAWGYLRHVAEIDLPLPLAVVPAAALGCAVLTAVSGIAASVRALAVRPVEALR